nr:GTPase [Alicyclobacillus sacchari]
MYVVGMANTGKSTLLNAIASRLSDKKAPYTVSRRPGTTLALSRLEIAGRYGRIELYDTPGLIHEARAIERLCADCLRVVVPQSRLRPRVYQLNPEQSLFLGGSRGWISPGEKGSGRPVCCERLTGSSYQALSSRRDLGTTSGRYPARSMLHLPPGFRGSQQHSAAARPPRRTGGAR